MITTTPKILLNKSLIRFPTMFFNRILVPWMQVNVDVVSQLSIIYVCNQQSQKKEDMFIEREDFKIFCVIVIIHNFLMSITKYLAFIL